MTALARVLGLVAFAIGLLWIRPAVAQSRVSAITSAPAQAEVGEPFVVELQVSSDEGPLRAEDPSLTPPIGVAATRPSISFFTNTTTVNGVRRASSQYRARWTLRAREPEPHAVAVEPEPVTGRGA